MKKRTYQKPIILFENFVPNSAISSCDLKAASTAEGNCGGYATDLEAWGVLFTTGYSNCDVVPVDAGSGLCYHVPTDSATIVFGS